MGQYHSCEMGGRYIVENLQSRVVRKELFLHDWTLPTLIPVVCVVQVTVIGSLEMFDALSLVCLPGGHDLSLGEGV